MTGVCDQEVNVRGVGVRGVGVLEQLRTTIAELRVGE